MYGRREDLRHKLVPVANERCEEPTVCGRIGTERGCRNLHATIQYRGRSIIKWMNQRQWRQDPFQTVLCQGQGTKERRRRGHWMDRRAYVVHESRQSQLERSRTSADCLLCFTNKDGESGLGKYDCCRQSIWPGSDYDSVIRHRSGLLRRRRPVPFLQFLSIDAVLHRDRSIVTECGSLLF